MKRHRAFVAAFTVALGCCGGERAPDPPAAPGPTAVIPSFGSSTGESSSASCDAEACSAPRELPTYDGTVQQTY